jgi:hypothetical protein
MRYYKVAYLFIFWNVSIFLEFIHSLGKVLWEKKGSLMGIWKLFWPSFVDFFFVKSLVSKLNIFRQFIELNKIGMI